MITPRRIVTALTPEGASYLARVEELMPATAAELSMETVDVAYPQWDEGKRPEIRIVWGCDELPFRLPIDPGATPIGQQPGPLGVRVSVVTYPPGWKGEMFWSNRVDVIWLLEGELTYRTDGGDEIVARRGDVIIQNGTNKAFENRGDRPVTYGAVLFGAVSEGPTPPLREYHGSAKHRLPAEPAAP